ncbi:hypothetical protein B0H10DRAFT_1943651 [Mycena sp. CBHHK59/15]|nr:hypothetical protein B0H10DRAFT_1943651 [Mycena sp. CBHHK59/15]
MSPTLKIENHCPPHFGPAVTWNVIMHKVGWPPSCVVDTPVQESVNTEDWYIKAGIPHHRGYLGCQAPLTASTLNLNSLASASMDDTFPKHAIFLIEDITFLPSQVRQIFTDHESQIHSSSRCYTPPQPAGIQLLIQNFGRSLPDITGPGVGRRQASSMVEAGHYW